MLIAYFRLFASTVNDNKGVPFVVMAPDNSSQFELSIRVQLGVFAAAGLLTSTTCGSTCTLMLSRRIH